MRLLIWDFDGTLAHRSGTWSGALLDVLDTHRPGHGVAREALREHLRGGYRWHAPERGHTRHPTPEGWWAELRPVFAQAFEAVGIAGGADLAGHVRAAYLDPARWQLYDDTLATLTTLQERGWRHVILSNHVPELPQLVATLGLSPPVERVFTSADLGYEKPHPAAFRAVLDAYPERQDTWMIGDNPGADVGGAAGVGLKAVLVRTAGVAEHVSVDLAGVLDVLPP